MDFQLILIMLSCLACCMFSHIVGGVHSFATLTHPCRDEERSALLEFIQALTIETAHYHKTDSWKARGDCCASWEGVECDQVTGHVISLDLSVNEAGTSYISGSISGNSTLFQLIHLQNLNFSRNDLRGQIPSSVFLLSNLSSLDLSGCGLSGGFPSSNGIFYSSNLRILDLSGNGGLSGNLPVFDGNNRLQELRIGLTSISGELPSSIAQLSFLKVLDISFCSFSGRLSSLGRLANLTHLDLSSNGFGGEMITWISNLTQLVTLDLSRNQFTGQIPHSLSSLANLESLWLQSNDFLGSIPSSLTRLTNLHHIDLSFNQLEGAIPNSFSNLNKLQYLNLYSNNLNGSVELDMFHKLGDLSQLRLSQNNLSLLVNEDTNSVVRDKYKILYLGSCNLGKFPSFLLNQSKLERLELSANNIHGMVPRWIWNHSLALNFLNVSHNFLTTIEDHPIMLPGSSLTALDISFNVLQGSLPVPPLSIQLYLAASNNFSGYLSPLFCNVSSLSVLDVPDNNISGIIPQCPDTFGKSISILNLRNNKLQGTIPQSWMHGSFLQMIALSQNQLQGKVPRSLVNCPMLEFIDFGNNCIYDTFPSWFGDFPRLKILLLQSNRFYGEIRNLEGKPQFAQLQIIDLSSNHFSSKLPSMFFMSWKSMKVLDADDKESKVYAGWLSGYYDYSMNITNKGRKMAYGKILTIFKVIDFSHNQFEGEIPTSIADLHGLHLLDLGYNNLTGNIPSWLGNLPQLESLDLSHNKLSGKIPQELSHLSFLEFFNVSYNNLSGIIPRGGQLDTFENSSYEGNPGLSADLQTPKTRDDEDDDEQVGGIEWMVIWIGFGSGLVVGVILGNEFVVRKPKWFVKLFGRRL